ncbi:MAG: hypothetical protein ACT4TC_20775, partial [Myxococcaceae bacterium]
MRRFYLLSTCFLLACGNPSGPSDAVVQPAPAQLFSAEITQVVLEVDYAEGAEPYTGPNSIFGGGDTWQLFRANAAKLFEGQNKTLIIPSQLSEMEALGNISGSDFTADRILTLAGTHRGTFNTSNAASFYFLWLDGYFRDDTGPRENVLGVSLGNTGVVAMFKPVIRSTQSVFAPNTERSVEQSTLVHEFGHAVGLVNNGIALASMHQDSAHGA